MEEAVAHEETTSDSEDVADVYDDLEGDAGESDGDEEDESEGDEEGDEENDCKVKIEVAEAESGEVGAELKLGTRSAMVELAWAVFAYATFGVLQGTSAHALLDVGVVHILLRRHGAALVALGAMDAACRLLAALARLVPAQLVCALGLDACGVWTVGLVFCLAMTLFATLARKRLGFSTWLALFLSFVVMVDALLYLGGQLDVLHVERVAALAPEWVSRLDAARALALVSLLRRVVGFGVGTS